MLRLLAFAVFFIGFYIYSAVMLPVTYFMAKSNKEKTDRLSLNIVRGALRMVSFIAGVRLTIKGKEYISKDEPVLYVGNHRSFFDIVVLYPLLPYPATFVAKQSLLKFPVIGNWLSRVNGLALDRKNNREALKTILKGIEYLKNDTSVVIFPEGTRCKEPEGNLMEFKEGSFKLATKSKRKIVPVAITGTSQIFEDHMPFVHSSKVVLEFLPPIDTAEMSKEEMTGIGERVREQILEIIKKNIG